MKISELMTKSVFACSLTDDLTEAARIMWEHDCGCVPVLDPAGTVAAMVTDRDVCMAAYTQGLPLKAISVSSAASKVLHSVTPDASVEEAEALMSSAQVRRLPVVDAQGRLVGVVSLNDFARLSVRPGIRKGDGLTAASIAHTLATVCAHRDGGEAPLRSASGR